MTPSPLDPSWLDLVVDGAGMVAYIEADGRFARVNGEYAAWFDARPEDLVGRRLRDVASPELWAAIEPFVERSLAGERVEHSVEARHPTRGTRTLHALAVPHVTAEGLRGLVVRVVDVTPSAPAATTALPAPDPLLLDAIPARVAYVDANERFGWVNRAYAEFLGATPAALLGRRVEEIIEPPAWATVRPRIRRALSGEAVRYETVLEYPGAGARRLEVTYTPHRVDGRTLGLVAHIIDVTERQRAEEALRTSEAELRAVFERAGSGAAEVDVATGRFVRVNPGFCELTGRSEAELLTLTPADVTHPDDRERDMVAFAPMLRGDREEYTSEKRYLRPDGSSVWVILNVTLIRDARGRPWRTVGVVQDITARKQAEEALRRSEERLRRLTDTLPAYVWRTDAQGRTTYVNERWSEDTGLPVERLLGSGWLDLVHPEDRAAGEPAMRAALARGEALQWEYRCRMRDGGYRWLLTRTEPVREQGVVQGWIGTGIDIEDKKRAEAALREADRRKDEFLAMLAHELRNPLAPIRTSVELLRLRPGTASAARAHDVIERQVQHLTRLVDDLLEVSRVTTGKVRIVRERVDARSIVAHAVEGVRALIEARRQRLEVDAAAEVVVEADRTRLAQVLGNLLHNAAKYTPEGGDIALSLARRGDEAVFTVRDTGVGIPADMLEHIFEPFVQVDRSLDRSQGGLGVGLTLARRLVELHGGTIVARSAGPGRGSEFVVRLPAVGAPAPMEEAAHAPEAPGGRGARVLVVDDNRDAAESLGALVEALGHEARVVHDGASALDVAARWRPDLVLLDIGLPRLDGYEVARRLRAALGPGVVLAAVTGYGRDEDRRRSRAAGFDHHLVKPVDVHVLERLLAVGV